MNKQIEEMARVMCGMSKPCILCEVQSPCRMRNCAHLLYAEGYRKASDVAREIFAEIVETMNTVYKAVQFTCYTHSHFGTMDSPTAMKQFAKLQGVKLLGDEIAELKKKYESEGADDEK
jgi:hypothetical protein